MTYYNESQESDLLQLYQGIFTGLGAFNKGIGECVNDSLLTVEKFQAAFDAFENAQVMTVTSSFIHGLLNHLEKKTENKMAKAYCYLYSYK